MALHGDMPKKASVGCWLEALKSNRVQTFQAVQTCDSDSSSLSSSYEPAFFEVMSIMVCIVRRRKLATFVRMLGLCASSFAPASALLPSFRCVSVMTLFSADMANGGHYKGKATKASTFTCDAPGMGNTYASETVVIGLNRRRTSADAKQHMANCQCQCEICAREVWKCLP